MWPAGNPHFVAACCVCMGPRTFSRWQAGRQHRRARRPAGVPQLPHGRRGRRRPGARRRRAGRRLPRGRGRARHGRRRGRLPHARRQRAAVRRATTPESKQRCVVVPCVVMVFSSWFLWRVHGSRRAANMELPRGWRERPSASRPGHVSYINEYTGERISWLPTEPARRERGRHVS